MLLFSVLLFSACRVVFAQPNPGRVTGDISVHDPTMCRDAAGTYFIFGACVDSVKDMPTHGDGGAATGTGIPIHTSTDRINWTVIGSVWPDGAPAATNQFTGTTNGYGSFVLLRWRW